MQVTQKNTGQRAVGWVSFANSAPLLQPSAFRVDRANPAYALAEPSQPEHTNPDYLILPRAGLAHCFTQLADTADQIVAATTAPPAHQDL